MRETFLRTCETFFESREVVKDVFKWENDSLVSVCAVICASAAASSAAASN